MTNSDTKNFSQNVSSSYHLEDKCKCNKNTCANARNVPKLRFKGYNDEWKKVKLKDICIDFIVPMRDKPKEFNGNIPWCRIEDIDGNYFNGTKSNKYVSQETIDKMNLKIIPTGSVICSCSASLGTYAINTCPIITNQTFIGLVCSEKISNHFLLNLMNTQTRKLKIIAGGTTIPYISREKFEEYNIKIPSLPEQEKIASFLTLIDKKIEKQKKLVVLLKKYKRGLLSAIFSQKLRFKDDNGNNYPAWEECRFDEIFQILGNNTLSRECLNYTDAGVKNIHYGDILVKYNTCINDEIDKIPNINSDINLDKISDDNYLKVGDVIMADTAEDYTVGKACEIVSFKAKILSGLHTIPCRPKRYFAKGYLGYYLNSAEYHDKLIPLITGIKVSAISKKEIKKTIIKYPIYMEQAKIANLLILIENKLNSNIKKLELLETYKKGLLQQLFI